MKIHSPPFKLSPTARRLQKLVLGLFLWSGLLLISEGLWGQSNLPRVERMELTERQFFASVGDQAVDFSLRFYASSRYHRAIYSVQARYSPKDKEEAPQQLVGLYGLNQLWLFKLNDSAQEHALLNFKFPSNHYWEDLEYVEALHPHTDKWFFSDSGHYRILNGKQEKVISEEKDFWVQKTEEYLLLSPKDSFLLQKLAPWTWNAEVISTYKERILLHYQYPSRAHVMGQCGAGEEAGYLLLSFSEQGQLQEWKNYPYASCNEGIYSEEDDPAQLTTIRHQVYHQGTDESWLLQLDLKLCLIKNKLITPKNP